jgi:CheY-like chemotaxis protein
METRRERVSTMKHILIVDSDLPTLGLLKDLLEEEGYEISLAFTGAKALTRIEQEELDLVIAECWLPGLKGEELCQVLKQDQRYQHIPVILMSTGYIPEQQIYHYDAILEKPFDLHVFLHAIRSVQ